MKGKSILNNNNKKETLKDLDKEGFSSIQNMEDNKIQKGRKSYNFRGKMISPVGNQSKFFPLDKFRIKSPQDTQKSTHYSSITYNHFRNKYFDPPLDKNFDSSQRKITDMLFPRLKSSLITQYKKSDLNSSYSKNVKNLNFYNNTILQNIQNNRKNNLISLNASDNNRSLVDEDFHNKRRNHKIIISQHTKKKALQKDKSQEGINNNNNNISYIYSNATSKKNKTFYHDKNIKENDKNENHNNNYILYDYKNKNNKNNIKKNYSINNYSISNINTNNINSRYNISENKKNLINIHKDIGKEKNKKEFDKSKYIRNKKKKR